MLKRHVLATTGKRIKSFILIAIGISVQGNFRVAAIRRYETRASGISHFLIFFQPPKLFSFNRHSFFNEGGSVGGQIITSFAHFHIF